MELKLKYTKISSGKSYDGTTYRKEVRPYEISDYMVNDITRIYENGTTDHSITISVEHNNKYTPEIYTLYEENSLTKIKEFKITTTSYGSLFLDEYKEFLKAQNDAMEVVEILTKKYCENTWLYLLDLI